MLVSGRVQVASISVFLIGALLQVILQREYEAIRPRDLCSFAAAEKKDVQTSRDLMTPANAKRQRGGRHSRGSGSNKPSPRYGYGLSKCTSSLTAKLPAVEDGPHLGVDAIRAIKEQLQADRQQVTGSRS